MMREVEAQPVRRHQRALLAHVVAQHRAQGGVEQVGGGVVPADGLAARHVDGGQRVLPRHELARHPRLVRDQPGQRVHGVVDLGPAGLGHDGAGIAHLPAALGVEGRLVQEDLDDVAATVAAAVRHPPVAVRPAMTATTRAGTS